MRMLYYPTFISFLPLFWDENAEPDHFLLGIKNAVNDFIISLALNSNPQILRK